MTNYEPGPQAGYLSTTATVVAGLTSIVPYPANIPGAGPVPPVLRWVVLLNASAFTLVVQQGMTLTQIAAFTSDKVQVVELQGGAPITVLAIAGSGVPQTGIDSTVYATWYEDEPPGQYPAAIGAGTTPNSQSSQIVFQTIHALGSSGLFLDLTGLVQPWMQALAIRYISDATGTADAMSFTIADASFANDFIWQGTLAPSQWAFVPISGKAVHLVGFPMTAGALSGPLVFMSGTIEIFGMLGPVLDVTLGAIAGFVSIGNVAQVVVAAAGNGVLIPFPGSGNLIRIQQVAFSQGVAPVANAAMTVRGGASGSIYGTWFTPAAPSQSVSLGPFVVGGRIGGPEIAESLVAFNPSTQAATFRCTYDLVPTSNVSR